MHFELFQNIQLPAEGPLPPSGKGRTKPAGFTAGEKIILYPFLTMILGLLVISGWSAILLATGNTETGGPIGMAARMLFNISPL